MNISRDSSKAGQSRRACYGRCVGRAASRRGFTLIELIVVMVLLTVAVGIAAPRLSAFFKGRALDSEARRVLALTRYAQDRAASEGIPVLLWFDTQNGKYGVRADRSFEEADRSEVRFDVVDGLRIQLQARPARPGAQPIARRLRSTLTATSLDSGARDNLQGIRFLPDGIIDPDTASSVILSDAGEYSVTISPAQNLLHYEIAKGGKP
jgi:type II secretion system protein H